MSNRLKQQVATVLATEPQLLPAAIAEKLSVSEKQSVSEKEVVFALPEDMVATAPGSMAQELLESLPEWGKVTTIVQSFGSIFEVKAQFPRGKVARGYYNLMGKDGQLHGHLKLDLITDIALVSKPFMGSESHYFGFFNAEGHNVFKVYLGRDNKRVLIADQVERFKALQQRLKN